MLEHKWTSIRTALNYGRKESSPICVTNSRIARPRYSILLCRNNIDSSECFQACLHLGFHVCPPRYLACHISGHAMTPTNGTANSMAFESRNLKTIFAPNIAVPFSDIRMNTAHYIIIGIRPSQTNNKVLCGDNNGNWGIIHCLCVFACVPLRSPCGPHEREQ